MTTASAQSGMPATLRNRGLFGRMPPATAEVLVYILVCIIWGTNWIAIKVAVTTMPAMLASGLRFLVAAPILIAICLAKGVPLRFPRGLTWFGIYVTVGYFGIPFLLYNFAEQYISSGLTAICFASVCVLMVVLSVPFLGMTLTARQIVGVLVSFGALALLVAHEQHFSVKSMWGVAAALVAAIMHAVAYMIIKKHGAPVHTLTLDTLPMAVAGVLLTGTSLLINHPTARMFKLSGVVATIELGIVASVIGLVVYFWLLQRINAITVSFIFVIFPVIAQAASVIYGDIRFQPIDILFIALVLGGFALAQLRTQSAATRPGQSTNSQAENDRAHPDSGDPFTYETLRQIYAHATRSYPEECCGFVRLSGVRECTNAVAESDASARTASTGFAFNAADTLELYKSIDTDDPTLVVYHSHPDVGAYMSAEDQRFAVMNGMQTLPVAHLVVDATAEGVRGAKLFRFDEGCRAYTEARTYEGMLPSGESGPKTAAIRRDRSTAPMAAGRYDAR
ncbi:MAG TPA: EamA family transporter [Streptosporangiaceae bacterium]|nr:EamA family transporter [Streptosporangiaceae bacterium]